ncbi:hypothetical protein [Bartonella choladocola]|uniref:hypothetical protein n=2 Tax=Bartonella TaxID=773 RepID=UPI001AED7581|nr:hypothetical protein [Bartonella choladocola]MBI0015505.1 hypothetical protein [Bartonella sp. B10834G3]
MVKTIYGDQVPVRGLNDRYSGGAINALTGTPWLVDRLISRWCRQITGAGSSPILSGSFPLSEKMRVNKCLADCSGAFKRSIERQMPLLLKIAISFACFLNGELMLLI